MEEAPRQVTLAKWSVALFILGLLPGIYQTLHPDGLGLGPGYEMAVIARNLVDYGTYGDSFRSLKTGPTATNPPLYPLFLALCIKLFGATGLMGAIVLLANTLANALVAAILPRVSLLFWGTSLPGIIAGVLSIVSARLMPPWDASFTQAGIVLFCLATAWLVERYRFSLPLGIFAGAAMGILFLLSQPSLMATIPWAGYLLLRKRARRQEAVRFLIVAAAAAILVNVPWLARNYAVWGKIVTRTNFGYTFAVSNNDCAASSLLAEFENGCYAATHPEVSVAEAQRLLDMGEPAYDHMRTREAWAWIASHPGRFLQLTRGRFVEFWFPALEVPYWAGYAIWAITILSLPGMIVLCRERSPADYFILAVFVFYPLLYYVVVSSVRYRTPVLWLSALVAGRFLATFLTARTEG